MGTTIIKEITKGMYSLPIHTKARIIKEATGVAFTKESKGAKRNLKKEEAKESTAIRAPRSTPARAPENILLREFKEIIQNSFVLTRSINTVAVSVGDGKSTDFPT